MDVECTNLTGAVAAVNVAGPNARKLMEKITDIDVSNEAFTYLDAKHAHVAGVPALILRIGFVGELGYEIHFPSPHGEYLWDALFEHGKEWDAAPFGLEPQRILRLEKQHILVGQDTDGESNPLEAAMSWIVKLDKDDFVGKWAVEHVKERGLEWMLVGFEKPDGSSARRGRPGDGRRQVAGPHHERALERAAAEDDRDGRRADTSSSEEGTAFDVRIDGTIEQAIVAHEAVLRSRRREPPLVTQPRLHLA